MKTIVQSMSPYSRQMSSPKWLSTQLLEFLCFMHMTPEVNMQMVSPHCVLIQHWWMLISLAFASFPPTFQTFPLIWSLLETSYRAQNTNTIDKVMCSSHPKHHPHPPISHPESGSDLSQYSLRFHTECIHHFHRHECLEYNPLVYNI